MGTARSGDTRENAATAGPFERTRTAREALMAEPVRVAMVGCGGMGRRHLAGLAELTGTEHNNVALVAVCDLNEQNAADLADEARQLLGHRPQVFTDLARMAREVEGLEAA